MQNACGSNKKVGTQIKLHVVPASLINPGYINNQDSNEHTFLCSASLFVGKETVKSNLLTCRHHINVMSQRTILQNISICAVYQNQVYITRQPESQTPCTEAAEKRVAISSTVKCKLQGKFKPSRSEKAVAVFNKQTNQKE